MKEIASKGQGKEERQIKEDKKILLTETDRTD